MSAVRPFGADRSHRLFRPGRHRSAVRSDPARTHSLLTLSDQSDRIWPDCSLEFAASAGIWFRSEMSSDNPYGGGPYPGQPGQGPNPGQGATPSGQPSAGGPSGYPQQPPAGGPPQGSGYTFGPFAPGSQPGGPQGGPPPGSYGAPPPPGYPPQPHGSQPPGEPPKRSKARIAIIAAATAVVTALGTIAIVLVNRDDPGATPQPSTSQTQATDPSQTAGAPPSEPPTSAPPPTTAPAGAKASDAVAGYLEGARVR